MLSNAPAGTLFALAPPPLVLTDAPALAVLTPASLPLVLAYDTASTFDKVKQFSQIRQSGCKHKSSIGSGG